MVARLAAFLDELILRDLGGELWEVRDPLRFYSAKLHKTFKVLAGTKTDLASIPRGLWNILPKSGKYNRSAVLHDAAYNGVLTDHFGYVIAITKKQADDLFLEAMLADGVNPVVAKTMHRLVRWFGRMHPSKQGVAR